AGAEKSPTKTAAVSERNNVFITAQPKCGRTGRQPEGQCTGDAAPRSAFGLLEWGGWGGQRLTIRDCAHAIALGCIVHRRLGSCGRLAPVLTPDTWLRTSMRCSVAERPRYRSLDR